MGHEASVSKVSDDQLFYLMSRGMEEDEAMAMIVRGFVEPIAKELPMEYALELNRLIELQMGGPWADMAPRFRGSSLALPRTSTTVSHPERRKQTPVTVTDAARERGVEPGAGAGGEPSLNPVLRPGRPPGADRPRGDLALHADQAARGILDGEESEAALTWETTLPTASHSPRSATRRRARRSVSWRPTTGRPRLAAAQPARRSCSTSRPRPRSAEPIVLRLHGSSVDDLVWGRLLVRVGRHAQATVAIVHTGSARYSAITTVLVGDGASANVLSLQDWDDDAVHLGRDAIRVAVTRRSSTSISFGATSSACTPTSSTPARAATPSCSASTSPTRGSTSSTACSPTTTRRGPEPRQGYRVRSRVRAPTPSGSATC